MKKIYLVFIIAVILISIILILVISKYKETKPADEPNITAEKIDYIREQQTAVMQSLELYHEKKAKGIQFASQCLGTVGNNIKFVVDIVNVPRNQQDNLPQNQCEDYRSGRVQHFIELDKDGNIVRIV